MKCLSFFTDKFHKYFIWWVQLNLLYLPLLVYVSMCICMEWFDMRRDKCNKNLMNFTLEVNIKVKVMLKSSQHINFLTQFLCKRNHPNNRFTNLWFVYMTFVYMYMIYSCINRWMMQNFSRLVLTQSRDAIKSIGQESGQRKSRIQLNTRDADMPRKKRNWTSKLLVKSGKVSLTCLVWI